MMKIIGTIMNVMAILIPGLTAKLAFRIFCFPFKPKLKDYQKDFLDSSLYDQFELDGDKIALYRWGNGPKKILFLHGWASHSFRWKEYVKDFDVNAYSVYAIDAPAHGLSSGYQTNIPKYVKAINHACNLIDGADTAIGHSFGGLSLLCSVYEYPNIQIDKLVIMGAPGEAMSFLNYYQEKIGLSNRTVALINKIVNRKFGHGLDYYSNTRFSAKIQKEVLVVHDKNDLEVPYSNAKVLHENLNHSQLILTEGLGHRQKGKQIVDLIYDFIENGIKESTASELLIEQETI